MRRWAEGPASSQSLWLHDQDEVMPRSPPRAVPAWRCPLGGSSGPRRCQSQGCPSFPFPSSATPAPAPLTPHPCPISTGWRSSAWLNLSYLSSPSHPTLLPPQLPTPLSHPSRSQRPHTPHAGWRQVLYTKVTNTAVPPAGHRGSPWPVSPLLGQKAMAGGHGGGVTLHGPQDC